MFSKSSKKIFLIAISLFIVLISGCGEDDEIKERKLTIFVQNEFGDLLSGVNIALYNTQDDWSNEVNGTVITNTDSQGKVELLDLTAGIYYIDIQSAELTNWSSDIELIYENQTELVYTIKENLMSNISSVSGKTFTQVSAHFVNSEAMVIPTECSSTTESSYFKNGNFQIKWGSTCENSGSENGTWEILNSNVRVFIADDEMEFSNFRVVDHSTGHYVIEDYIDPYGLIRLTFVLKN